MLLFICHTGQDKDYVERIASILESNGIPCWYYERDNHGESVGPAVDAALDASSHMLFVMSRSMSAISTFVANELSDSVRSGRKVIPLRVMMPPNWFPQGSRGYVSSFPDINDVSGGFDSQIVEEIRRVVFRGTDNGYCLQDALESAGIIYSIDKNGDFQTEWPFVCNGQECHAFIELLSKTSFVSGGVHRTVSGYFRLRGDRKAVVDVLKSSKVNWQLREEQKGQYFISCSFLISPDANGATLRNVCQNIAEILQTTIVAILQYKAGEGGLLSKIGKAIGVGAAALVGLGAIAAVSSHDK